MKNTNLVLASIIALSLSAPAFAADKESYESKTKIEKDVDGNYKEKTKTEKTDVAGTTNSVEKDVKVKVKSSGETDKTVKTTEVTDPKGLMNKETTKTTDTVKAKADGTVESDHKKTVNGKTVEENSESTK